MDIDLHQLAMGLRPLLLVWMTLIFVAIVWWAYSPRRRDRLDACAHIPLGDDPR